ncbi:MAG: CapA family protein, partial [Planctomycetota bacterium]
MGRRPRLPFTTLFLLLGLGLGGCGGSGPTDAPSNGTSNGPVDPPIAETPGFSATIQVVDERGAPIAGAFVRNGAAVDLTDAQGQLTIVTDQPVLLVVEASGHLREPHVVHRESTGTVERIRLLDAVGPTGAPRLVMHFGGDAMMGRRYVDPNQSRTATVEVGDGGISARTLVSALAPLFGAADISVLNLETAIGDRPLSEAYPRKRFLLQSVEEVPEALHELSVDLVTLGNNHMRDWLEPGTADTITALDNAGIPHTGGGVTRAEAEAPAIVEALGRKVGFASFTTVNGDFVNDSLPGASVPVPGDLDPEEAWQYEERSFGFRTVADPGHIPTAARRIGPAWDAFKDVEDGLDEDDLAALWTALATVYPELQDWVARRGHGGAAHYSDAALQGAIHSLQQDGADLICVQLHAGFQFAPVKSETLARIARDAIDHGAHVVIAHHPHVLQGFEFYDGRLIAHSLGNLVFDQDFLATFSTLVLRTVYEGDTLIEARCFPVQIESYRPTPVGGASARDVVRSVHHRSALEAVSARVNGDVRVVPQAPGPNTRSAWVRLERGTGVIEPLAPAFDTHAVTATHTKPTP